MGRLGGGLKLRSVVTLCFCETQVYYAQFYLVLKGKWQVLCVHYRALHQDVFEKHNTEMIFPVVPNFNL